jgi:hypothetical protein
MPTVPGFLARRSDAGYTDPGYISNDLDAYTSGWINSIATHVALRSPGAAALTSMLPVEANGSARTGYITRTYSDDYYYRVHVYPSTVDVGNVVTDTQRTIEVWNAHFVQKTLAAITATGTTDGLLLSGQPAPPLSYSALQSRTYTLTAKLAGAPVIDARYEFDFGPEDPAFRVTGRRIVVWSFGPDWGGGVLERLTWATDVHAHYDGTEQRVRMRQHARRAIEYRLLAPRADVMRRMEALLFGWGGRAFLLPVWWEADRLAATLSAGATTITVTDASLKDYTAGGYVVIERDRTAEAAQIASITGNTLTLALPTQQAWSAGSRVMPGVLATLDEAVPVARPTDTLAMATVRWSVDELSARDRSAQEIGPTYSGRAVLDERPDRAEDVGEEWARTWAVLDSITGIVMRDDTSGSPVIRRTYTWMLSGRTAIDRWKRWASARAGRLSALWLPSWADDLRVVQAIGSGDTSIVVEATGSAQYVGTSALRPALRVETTGGAVYHRAVTGVAAVDATKDSISIDSALGVALQPADVRRVMWLALARLESDAVEIAYESDSVARLTATFRLVKQ